MVNQTETIVKKRDDTFDIIKGICILLMIVGHCPVSILGIIIYSFHMPVFFFIAGYFFKQNGFWKCASSGIRRLLIPFACVYIFCIAIAYVIEYFGWFSKIVMSYIEYKNPVECALLMSKGLPVWFLVSLFWCRMLFFLVRKIRNDVVVFAVVIIAAILAVNLYNYFKLPLMFYPSVAALGFFVLGHVLASRNIFSNEKKWRVFPLLLCAWVICISTGKSLVLGRCEYSGFYILDILGALGIFVSLYLVVKNCSTKSISWNILKWCGVNSLIILCVHSVELNFVDFNAVKRWLLPVFFPYELYIAIAFRLAFDMVVTYALIKSRFVKRYIFAQYG